MRVVFNVQDASEIVTDGFQLLVSNLLKVLRATFKKSKKEDQKVLFYIHQCVDVKAFDKLLEVTRLEKYYGGNAKTKKTRF